MASASSGLEANGNKMTGGCKLPYKLSGKRNWDMASANSGLNGKVP